MKSSSLNQAVLAASVVVLGLLGNRPAPAVTYTVVDLNPSGFTESYANGTSGTLQVGGGYGTATGGDSHALLWSGMAGGTVDLNPSGFTDRMPAAPAAHNRLAPRWPSAMATHARFSLERHGSRAVDLNPSEFAGSWANGTNGTQQVGHGQGTTTDGFDHALLWSGTAATQSI